MDGETTAMLSCEVAQTLQRILALFNDELLRFAPKLCADLRGIEASSDVLLDLLRDADPQQMASAPAWFWLLKLKGLAYDAEAALDDLSYHVLHSRVHNSSLPRLSFLIDSDLVHRVKTVNHALRKIYDRAKNNLKLMRISSTGRTFRFRPCSEFCLSFPINFRVQRGLLIQLWMAAGLFQSYNEAAQMLENIVPISNSNKKEVEKDDDDHSLKCKIQDLMRTHGMEHVHTPGDRYLYATTSTAIPKDKESKLRSLFLDEVEYQKSWMLRGLLILVFLNNSDMQVLPQSIGRMKHLRYLDVSNTSIKALPKFITKLYNLQTLYFFNCKQLNQLPRQFSNLINLKNIAFSFQHQMPFGLGRLTCLERLPFFVVGSDRGGSIDELGHLNGLRGNLAITRLEYVEDVKEAERANLQQKEKLGKLSFQWSYGSHGRFFNDGSLLEALKPSPNIQKLEIKYYMGRNWPSWMMRTSSMIHNLVSLTLEQCWNLQLPLLGDLPCLEILTIKHMERVKCIHDGARKDDDNEGKCLFPALKSLSLGWMQNLAEWSYLRWPLDNKVVAFPSLETLSIQSCPKLTSFPMKDLSALRKIEIKDCGELRLLFHEQQSFPSITNISIEGCPKLTHLRNWLLYNTHFNRFKVRRCELLNFISADLGLQSSLVSLEINCCKGLTFFPEDILCKLTQLRTLSIGAFAENLDDFRYLDKIQNLERLKELEVWGSDFVGRIMSHFPEQLQQLTGLESLTIMGFTAMKALPEWVGDLQCLGKLSLNYCWHLEYQSTATIIKRLPSFKQLRAVGCHALEQHKHQLKEFARSKKIGIQFT